MYTVSHMLHCMLLLLLSLLLLDVLLLGNASVAAYINRMTAQIIALGKATPQYTDGYGLVD